MAIEKKSEEDLDPGYLEILLEGAPPNPVLPRNFQLILSRRPC